jgi:SAM-dependent methyltransferase
MLLADFVRLRKGMSVLDLGSGAGTLGVLLCGKYPECTVTGVELDPGAHNAALENIIDKGDTRFTCTLPSRLPVLFEAAAEFSALPADGKLKVAVKAVKDIHKMTYTLKLDNAKSFRSVLTPRNNPGFTSEVRVNGKKVTPQQLLTIPARAEIRIDYRSAVFRDPADTFVKFPYLSTKGFPIMRIVLPDDPNEAEKFAAERIIEYFKFTGEKKITGRSSVGFSKKNELKNYDRYFEISCGRGKTGVYRQGRGIQLHGTDPLTLRENTGALLQVMDRRFPWFMNFVMHSKMSGEVIRKFGLGKVGLPWKPCFETEKMKVAK